MPGYGEMIRDVEVEMSERLRGEEMIVAGELNMEHERIGRQVRDKEIAEVVATSGLEDISAQLLPQCQAWNQDRIMWAVARKGREMRYWTDYIVGSYCQIFQNVSVLALQ